MARNREPILKQCRALGISPGVMGIAKESNRNPNANKRKKVSEYGMQLKEKQKLKFIYGVLEKPFYHYYEIASKKTGKTGENLLVLLESRLDNIVFRMGFANTRAQARQFVVHNHFRVNGKKVNIPSYLVKAGDVVTLCEKSRALDCFKVIAEENANRTCPMWIEADKENFSAKVVRMPQRDEIDYEVDEQLIIELYSK